MVKRITFSVSDELHDKIQHFKDGFKKRYSISKICQQAIEEKLGDAMRRDAIYKDGFQYGQKYVDTLTREECKKAKQLADTFPRNHPREIIDIFMKTGLINQDSLQKHLEIIKMWKDCVYDRVREIKEMGSSDDWDEWLGTPPTHEGVEIWETQITEEPSVLKTSDGQNINYIHKKSSADIRHEAMRELWREGLIAGIKETTKSLEEGKNENE